MLKEDAATVAAEARFANEPFLILGLFHHLKGTECTDRVPFGS